MSDELELRRRPTQARSAATFDHILDTAVHLLEDVGWDGFTTNLLAERAGIGIQTLYRYFPNKLSVVATLAHSIIEEWDSWFEDTDQFLSDDPVKGWEDGFDLFIEGVKNQPGGVAIRQAMLASPVLRELDRQDNRRNALRFTKAFVGKYQNVDEHQFYVASLVVIEASLAILDLSFGLPSEEADQLLDNSREMQAAFMRQKLSSLMDQS